MELNYLDFPANNNKKYRSFNQISSVKKTSKKMMILEKVYKFFLQPKKEEEMMILDLLMKVKI